MRREGWAFASEDALLVAMKSDAVPVRVLRSPVYRWPLEDGGIGVLPAGEVPRTMAASLGALGVQRVSCPSEFFEVPFWPALLACKKKSEEGEDPVVVFAVQSEASVLALIAELIRLGCHRCSYQVMQGKGSEFWALVKVEDPPYYSLLLAADPHSAYRVFVPVLAGQEQAWIERGYTHPAVLGVLQAEEEMDLVGSEGLWLRLPASQWQDVQELVDVVLPAIQSEYIASSISSRLRVNLRLSAMSQEEPATLWVLPRDGISIVEAIVASVPDDVVKGLLYAVVERAGEGQTLVLRSRPNADGPPVLALSQPGYVSWMNIANLYLPVHRGLEPPLRRNTLRELLAPDSDRVYWLSEGNEEEELSLDSVAESEFFPLADWAQYIVHSQGEALQSWTSAATFSFESFVSIGGEWNEAKPKREKPVAPVPAPRARSQVAPLAIEVQEVQVEEVLRPRTREVPKAKKSTPVADEKELAELERRFVVSEDVVVRRELWQPMALLHTTLGHKRDATLCWSRAFWQAEEADAESLAEQWREAEVRLAGGLPKHRYSKNHLHLAVATWVQLAETKTRPTDAQRGLLVELLEPQEASLSVRCRWLVRSAMARLAGGDSLLLARTRDALLRRLHSGLSIEKDVPTFLRFAGALGGDRDVVANLGVHLEELWSTYKATKRKRSVVEAPEEKTRAFVGLQVSFGFASLGRLDQAKQLKEECCSLLDSTDLVDNFLVRSYVARIDQALAGKGRGTPLPPTLAATLEQLPKLDRYKVDRLRSGSMILEPQERLDPMLAFQRAGDSRGQEFTGLRGQTDPVKVVASIRDILSHAGEDSTSDADRFRLLDGSMDFLLGMDEADAVPMLGDILASMSRVAPARRVLLLEKAMTVAGFFGRDELAVQLTTQLSAQVRSLPTEDAISVAAEFGSCLRSMRRVGLSEQAVTLLEEFAGMSIGESPAQLIARIHVASGQAYLGHIERALVTLRATERSLSSLKLTTKDRLSITRALSLAWSQTPPEYAAPGILQLAGQLPRITDSFNTNSHFCLSVVSFMDSLVLALASGDLAMGDFGRRWLDEDEFLVRTRMHREMGTT